MSITCCEQLKRMREEYAILMNWLHDKLLLRDYLESRIIKTTSPNIIWDYQLHCPICGTTIINDYEDMLLESMIMHIKNCKERI